MSFLDTNFLEKYIEQVLQDIPLCSIEHEFYTWIKSNIKQIEIKPSKSLKLPFIISPELIERGDCFNSAIKIFTRIPKKDVSTICKLHYVEGFVVSPICGIFKHAWNSYNGNHFDATAEQHFFYKKNNYYEVIELTLIDIIDVINEDMSVHSPMEIHFARKLSKHKNLY